MLLQNVFHPAQTECVAPIAFALKKGGSFSYCIDYKKLNNLAIQDSFPTSRMDKAIDFLDEATVFSTRDINSDYWLVEIEDKDQDKTAFTFCHGLFHFKRMKFGLKECTRNFSKDNGRYPWKR